MMDYKDDISEEDHGHNSNGERAADRVAHSTSTDLSANPSSSPASSRLSNLPEDSSSSSSSTLVSPASNRGTTGRGRGDVCVWRSSTKAAVSIRRRQLDPASMLSVFHLLCAALALAVMASVMSPVGVVAKPGKGASGGASYPFRWRKRWEMSPSVLGQTALAQTKVKKRTNYVDLRCRGMYDQGILTQLERICEDCYNLYKDAEVHGYCRMDCFSSETFRQCLQSLLLDKESDFYEELVQIIGKKKRKR